ncbi:MAG: hypothetical protein ACO34J_06570 [Prochlorothrix sp.]
MTSFLPFLARISTISLGLILGLALQLLFPGLSLADTGLNAGINVGFSASLPASFPASLAANPEPLPQQTCAWPYFNARDTFHGYYSDTHGYYWIAPFRYEPGGELEIRGHFPDARFISIDVFDDRNLSIYSIHDEDIAPDLGSSNPFQTAIAPAPHRYHFSVSLPDRPDSGETRLVRRNLAPNSLARNNPARSYGRVIYRLYGPKHLAALHQGKPMPVLTVLDAQHQPLQVVEACRDTTLGEELAYLQFGVKLAPKSRQLMGQLRAADDRYRLDRVTQAALPPRFFLLERPAESVNGQFVHPWNSYLHAPIAAPSPGEEPLVLVRGKAPQAPDTAAGESVTQAQDLRYWSLCMNNQTLPYAVLDCVADNEVKLDEAGFYTVVVANDAPALIAEVQGRSIGADLPPLTPLQWGTEYFDKILILRHMLPKPDFEPFSISAIAETRCNVPDVSVEQGIACARGIMGDYYPEVATCDRATLRQGNWSQCFGDRYKPQ